MILEYNLNKKTRIDKWISNHQEMEEYSRSFIKKSIEDGDILLNGEKTTPSCKLKEKDKITISIPEPKKLEISKENIPINIVYEDNDILVVNKQRGLVVHPGNGNWNSTLVNAIMYHCEDSLSDINGTIRPGIVHRIDKDTSGLLVIAKNNYSHNFLARQFKEHSILREYLAICSGILKYNKIKIDKPLGRSKNYRIKYDIDTIDGKRAITHIEVIERFKKATYIKARLETGRTHQIRVHLKSIGHPLVGDPLYYKSNQIISGQALHAKTLGFIHPQTKEFMKFDSSLPKDFNNLINFFKR